MIKKTVIVLLSTYNGEKYLSELIDSILSQTYPYIHLIVRDDGSKDSTCEIIQSYCKENKNITFIKGDNLGPAKGFMELVRLAPDADFYAFADQDDIWLPYKIEKGIDMLVTQNANLYHSNFQMVDKDLNLLPTTTKPNVFTIGQASILYPCTGCTMIFSKKLRDIVNSYKPSYMVMHDAWIFKLAMAVSQPIVFDKNSYIYYRQHEDNVLGGIQFNTLKRIKLWLIKCFYPDRSRSMEMKELINGFASIMDSKTFFIVSSLANYLTYPILKRIRLAFDKNFVTEVPIKNILFKISIIVKSF